MTKRQRQTDGRAYVAIYALRAFLFELLEMHLEIFKFAAVAFQKQMEATETETETEIRERDGN